MTGALDAAAGLVLLYLGGECLVLGASSLALRLRVSALAVGLTVVAFGTSAPELAVSVDAVLVGKNDIAIGNVVGSNIANVALILGLAALLRPIRVHAALIRYDLPIMVGCSLLVPLVLLGQVVSRIEGVLLLAGLAVYVGFRFWETRRSPHSSPTTGSKILRTGLVHTAGDVALVLGGLAALVYGAQLFVDGSVALARVLGVSEAVIALTVVAVGTSLPELATSVLAAARGHGDIATGNVIGSSIFNTLGILGATALVHPLVRGGIAWADVAMMVAVSAALLVMMYTRLILTRAEGALLLGAYVVYLVLRVSA